MLKILVFDISRTKCASNMEYVKLFLYSFLKPNQKKIHSSGRFKNQSKNKITKQKLFTEFWDISIFLYQVKTSAVKK